MAIDVETIKNLTNKQKLLMVFITFVVVISAFIWFVFIPKNEEIHRLKQELVTLSDEITELRVKVRRLAQLKREDLKLQRKLKEMKEQLPPEAEVEFLLKQVSDLGGRSGLDFKLWRPGSKVMNSSGLYSEIPVSIKVAGGYHSVGVFFDKISKMRRIINISDIRMTAPTIVRNQVVIQTSFSATAFASADKTEAAQ